MSRKDEVMLRVSKIFAERLHFFKNEFKVGSIRILTEKMAHAMEDERMLLFLKQEQLQRKRGRRPKSFV